MLLLNKIPANHDADVVSMNTLNKTFWRRSKITKDGEIVVLPSSRPKFFHKE